MNKPIKAITVGVLLFSVIVGSAKATEETLQSSKSECDVTFISHEQMVNDPGVVSKLAQSGNCCITCSGGTACTNCKDNEVCSKECRSSGQPGVSCHPR